MNYILNLTQLQQATEEYKLNIHFNANANEGCIVIWMNRQQDKMPHAYEVHTSHIHV